MNPQKSWPQHTLIQKRNRGRHTGGALLSCKKGRPDRNLRDLRADEDEQTGGSGLSETVDRQGYVKSKKKTSASASQSWDGSGARNAAIAMKPSPSFWNM